MCKIFIKGLSAANRWRLNKLLRAEKVEQKEPAVIEVHAPVFYKRQDSLWFGGTVAEIHYRGWRFELWANGDVYADLYELPNMRHFFHVKDKRNAGNLSGELRNYIHSDRALYAAELGKHPKYRLDLDYNNWWEGFAVTPDGEFIDMMWCLESDKILPAIAELFAAMDEIIKTEGKGSCPSAPMEQMDRNEGEEVCTC